jgi:hypothetical protein
MLCYKQLLHTIFTDTMFAATPSKQGNKMAQVYSTSFGSAGAHPMKRKGEAHETLSLVFHCDGVPPTMVIDNSKEQTLGEFQLKLREADCHHQVTKPYFPWQQAAEGCIRKLNQGSSRKMLQTGLPKPLWDHSLELEALVRSFTSNDIYMTSSWENLSDLKESHPIETVKYAKIIGVNHEPAFNLWVPHVLKKRDWIILLVKKGNPRFLKKTHKFGIEVPKTVKDALEIDRRSGNTFWADAIAKEMKDVCVAFKILLNRQSAPIGYQKIPCHMIFDIKMEDFCRKARLVARGHRTEAPMTITYASVVSHETVCIALLMATLNDLEVKIGNVVNAYITAPVTKKVWTVLGPEFGSDAGKSAVIVRILYGLKSAGAAFFTHLASFMRQMGYTSC